MAYANWTHNVFTSTGTGSTILDGTGPLVDTMSLSNSWSSGNASMSFSSQLDGSHARGYLRGRIRTIIEFGQWIDDTSTISECGFGVYYLADDLDISNNLADFFVCGAVRDTATPGSLQFVVGRPSTGNKSLDDLRIGTDASSTDQEWFHATNLTGVTQGDTLPFEVEWYSSESELNGVRHILKKGNINDLDYTNLSTVFDVVTPGPVASPVVEGFAFWRGGTATISSGLQVRWDSTVVTSLT